GPDATTTLARITGIPETEIDRARLNLRTRATIDPHKSSTQSCVGPKSGSARLLPRLIAGRVRGPVFLAERRSAPARTPAAADLCPATGRGRLSYRRAEELFHAASGGWTLHQLRHSAITHLAEADVGLALLMAKSRHTSLRSLQRYARPGPEAVAKLTAEHDPERSRR
ncbi:MAG: site-specific recombinase, partial [Solirubrobacteraceae bacterium]